MVRPSTPSPRILQSGIAALALTLLAGTPAFAVAPVAFNDSAVAGDGVSVIIPVLANDTDADSDALQIESVTTPSNGTAVIEGDSIRYTSTIPFSGPATFSYTVKDENEETATAQVTVTVSALPLPSKTVDLFSARTGGSAVPGAGDEESNVAEGAAFTGFGIPSINDNGEVAFLGRYKSTTDKGTVTAVFAGSPVELVAKKGDVAPDTTGQPQTGVAFSSFRDPLLSETGTVAFISKLSGEGITSATSYALFTNAFGGDLVRVLQAGDAAPGLQGATIRKITSVALGSQEGAEVDNATIFFTAALNIDSGTPAVTRADDLVLFAATENGISPILREGQTITAGLDTAVVKSFRTLVARSGAAGQGRGAANYSGSTYGVVLASTTTGGKVVGYAGNDAVYFSYSSGGDAVGYGEDALWSSFGIPTQNFQSALAFTGKVKTGTGTATSANNVGIFVESESSFSLSRSVAKGDTAPGISGATFSSFKEPVNATGGRVAFGAKVSGATSADDQGIWFGRLGTFELVAREGAQPPGVPAGAKWASFTSLALSDGFRGAPLFVAKLARPKDGEPNPAGVLSTNSVGLWARDNFSRLHLVARYGDTIVVNGESKTVRSFVALKSVTGSPAQNRFFNNVGEIYYRVICTDGTQVLVRTQMPYWEPPTGV